MPGKTIVIKLFSIQLPWMNDTKRHNIVWCTFALCIIASGLKMHDVLFHSTRCHIAILMSRLLLSNQLAEVGRRMTVIKSLCNCLSTKARYTR